MNDLYLRGVGMTSRRTRERLIERLVEKGIDNIRVLEVMRALPRHIFVDEAMAHRAYEDTALPIGHGQTLSQPYIVARMTELLLESATSMERVLEIGTGSGYQTAVLSPFCRTLYSVERIAPLQDKARQRLKTLGVNNVILKHADGNWGWPARGPFNAILSAAAPHEIPQQLIDQLAPGGVLLTPVGGDEQSLARVIRDAETDEIVIDQIEPVKFVPLLGGVIQ